MKKSVFNEILSKYEDFIYLGKISVINGGYAFKSSNYCSEGIRVIRISDFDENGIKDDNIVRYKNLSVKYLQAVMFIAEEISGESSGTIKRAVRDINR